MEPIIDILTNNKNLNFDKIEDLEISEIKNKTKIFLNGDWYGVTNEPKKQFNQRPKSWATNW